MKTSKLDYIGLVRSDMSNWLIHFMQYDEAEIENVNEHPFRVLKEVIRSHTLRGSSRLIKSGDKCVCFSEAPLTKAIALIKYSDHVYNENKSIRAIRYAPFGVAVKKKWLYQKGGRPVIYQSEDELGITAPLQKYRHVRYEPNDGIDFTWEREWRIECNELNLTPEKTIILVKNNHYRDLLLTNHYDQQRNSIHDGKSSEIEIYPWGRV